MADHREAVRLADEAVAACPDRGRPSEGSSGPPLRWHLVDAVEETGRHAGLMDIVRERTHGATGR